jgi:hypothetical protein
MNGEVGIRGYFAFTETSALCGQAVNNLADLLLNAGNHYSSLV